MRLFPTDANAVEAEIFADASTPVKVSAWTLDAKQTASGIHDLPIFDLRFDSSAVYDLGGRSIFKPQSSKGLYIQNGRKIIK